MPNPVSSSNTPRFFSFHVLNSHQAPHPQSPSVRRCRPSRDGHRQPRPLEVEETRPPLRVHQAHTVPGSYRCGRGSQRNVAYLLTVSCWAKYRGRETLDMSIFLLPILSADTAYQAREQGQFRHMIHPCLHPVRRREIYGARHMCIADAVYCSSCCCCAAVLLRLLLRLLLLLLLQLLRGCDQNREGVSRLGE